MSNFLAEVLHAKGSATVDELNELLRTLDSKISQMKTSVIQSLNSTFVQYDTDLDRVVQWYTEIVEIQNQLDNLEGQLGKDKQVLQSTHEDLEAITCELGQSQASILLLKSLVEIVKNLERADPADYYHASMLIKEAENELASIAHSFPSVEDHVWVKQLRARFSDLVVDVYDRCRKEWGNVFRFEKNCLTISPHAANPSHLVESLKNIKSFNRVWEKFMNMLWQELFKPACSKDFKIEICEPQFQQYHKYEVDDYPVREKDTVAAVTSVLNTTRTDGSPDGTIITAKKRDKSSKSARELFENLSDLVCVFYEFFKDNIDNLDDFSETIAPKINEELGSKYLKNLILQGCEGDIEKAKTDIVIMKKFIRSMECNYDFRFPQGCIFEDIETNFDDLFRYHIREALIVNIRELIKSDVHNTTEINYETVPNSSLSPDEIVLLRRNPALFPKCVISKPISEMVRLLKEHVKQYPDDVSICTSVFSLYLALVKIPKHEADAEESVPLTSVLVHNNSLFLAHHAGFTFEICDDMVPDLRSKASQAIAFMMRCVRSKLNEMITTAMSSIEERVERNIDITHDFLVITSELKRLNSVMTGVLPPLGWRDILATLVDHTVNEMCSKVLAWDDIPANTASELAIAFTQFTVATSGLFKGDAETPREIEALTSVAVKKWQRFKLLIFVLTASMKEIEAKWVGGCGPLANEFTAEEVRRLVRALFQNTDRRAAFLATIK